MKIQKKISICLLCALMISNLFIVNVQAKSTVKLNKTEVKLNVGKSTTLKLSGAKPKEWSSLDPKIATINSKGKVTAKKLGYTVVKVRATNGKFYKCNVIVKPKKIYTQKEAIKIIEKTFKKKGYVKTTDYMTKEELAKWGPTAGMGWGEASVDLEENPQKVANDLVDFMEVCGYNMYYIENLGKSKGYTYTINGKTYYRNVIILKVYRGTI